MSLTLYYYRHCPSCKTVLSVLKELDAPVKLIHLNLRKKEQLQDWFLKINPAHTVPVLVDDDLVITESRPILSYLVDKLSPDSGLHPRDIKIRVKVDQFLYFDQGTLTPSNRKIYFPIVLERLAAPPDEAIAEYKDKLAMLETHLTGKKFLVTDRHTIADIAIYITLSQARLANFDFSEFKAVQSWINTMKGVLAGEEEIVSTPLVEYLVMVNAEPKV